VAGLEWLLRDSHGGRFETHGADHTAGCQRRRPETAIVFVKTMNQLIDETLWQRRLWGVMFSVFAAVALVLAAVGIYGVSSFSVSQRTREIGGRMALGAQTGNILRMVLAQGLKLSLVGIANRFRGGAGAEPPHRRDVIWCASVRPDDLRRRDLVTDYGRSGCLFHSGAARGKNRSHDRPSR
jgi:FtsX-like permease family protein